MVICLSCKSEYEKYVTTELSKNINNDSLIFGMRMGQTQKDFFDICWELNRQHLIHQGSGQNAKYIEELDSSMDQTLKKEMLFYGIFDKQKIMRGMDMTFSYSAWSPWMKSRHADTLLEDLRVKFLKEYPGNKFIEMEIDNPKIKALVKIDGNRQILMFPKNDKDVAVKIEDLNFKYKKK